MRGGVPENVKVTLRGIRMSPRVWGCTERTIVFVVRHVNVPTCVGVYRTVQVSAATRR